MNELKFYHRCKKCGGDGTSLTTSIVDGNIVVTPEDPCLQCAGTGYYQVGMVDGAETLADILDRVNDIKEKVDEIKEKVDSL